MIAKISKKNLHNYFSSLLIKVILVLSQLFLIPLYIHELGFEMYGEWLILTTIPNYLLLSDLGITLTVTNEICRLINLEKYREQQELYESCLSFLLVIGIILFFIFIILSFSIDFIKLFNLKMFSNTYVIYILLCFLLNVILSLIFRVTIGYFKALNVFYKHEYFLALTLLLDFLFTLFLLKIKAPLYFIPLSMAFIRGVMIFIINILLCKISFYRVGLTMNLNRCFKLIPSSLKLSFFQLGSALFIQGCTLLVGILLGAKSVVVFNTVRTMVNSLKAFISVLYIPTMQEFTLLITKNYRREAMMKVKNLYILIFFVSILSSLSVFFLRDEIFNIWIKDPFEYDQLFLVFMLIAISFQNIWNAGSMLPMSINKMNELAIYPILGITVLVFQYFFLEKTRLIGLATNFIIMDIIMLLVVIKVNFNILIGKSN